MKGTFLYSAMAGLMLLGGVAQGKPLAAKLVLGEGRSWQGQVVSREGDSINFSTGKAAQPIRVEVATIQQLTFKVSVDTRKISSMMGSMDYAGAIAAMEKALAPFAEYNDVPSNLVRYNSILMELYYRNGQYDKSLELSSAIRGIEGVPSIQSKAQVYTALALMDSGREDEAKLLLTEFGWDKPSAPDVAAEELYIRARLNVLNGNYVQALEEAAKVVAFHSQDPEWIQPAELLCAEIYTEMGMYDSASEVCRQIMILYKDTPEAEKAGQLKVRVDGLNAGK